MRWASQCDFSVWKLVMIPTFQSQFFGWQCSRYDRWHFSARYVLQKQVGLFSLQRCVSHVFRGTVWVRLQARWFAPPALGKDCETRLSGSTLSSALPLCQFWPQGGMYKLLYGRSLVTSLTVTALSSNSASSSRSSTRFCVFAWATAVEPCTRTWSAEGQRHWERGFSTVGLLCLTSSNQE